jgi:SPX domain protein involved in polyphosphate accumulation
MFSANIFSKKSPALDDINWRFEYKYHLTMPQYLAVKSAILPNMSLDEYTKAAPDNKYFVRSLYFDSFFFNAFHDKADGNCDRLKLRIRTYVKSPDDIEILKAEIKVRKNVTTEKHVAPISYIDYLGFMDKKRWPGELLKNVILAEFERYYHQNNLIPVVLVQYEREGYRARTRDEIRITFDHHVRSARADELFPKDTIFRVHSPGSIILEIKCNKRQPDWLQRLIRDYGMMIISNSKYVQGVIISHPSVVTPSWSA